MKVIARSGVRVPMERAARKYITDQTAVDVPDTAYYVRRVMERDLVQVTGITVASPSTVAATDAGEVPAGDKKTTKGAQ